MYIFGKKQSQLEAVKRGKSGHDFVRSKFIWNGVDEYVTVVGDFIYFQRKFQIRKKYLDGSSTIYYSESYRWLQQEMENQRISRNCLLQAGWCLSCWICNCKNKTKKTQPNNNYQIFPSFSRKDLLMYLFFNKKYSNNFNIEFICIVSFLNIQELCHRVMITFCRNLPNLMTFYVVIVIYDWF